MMSFRILPVCACAGLLLSIAPAVSPATAQSAAIAAVIRSRAAQFSGTVLVSRQGKTVFQESFGLANRQFDVPNTNATRYKIASITKFFTSVVAMQLVDEGKLALRSPIVTYLPVCGGDLGTRATVHQLLNHTSGMKDVVAVKSKEDGVRNGIDLYQRPYTVDAILMKYCSAAPDNAPGTAFNYNNGDYIVLGRIIEAIERQPFEAVLKRRILEPLGLDDSGMLFQHRIVPRLANTYFTREDGARELSNDLPVYDENWYAAGAMYSTAVDLRDFAEAVFAGSLLHEKTRALLLTPGLDDYGYGVWVREDTLAGRKVTTVTRPGQIMGANTVIYRVVQEGLTVIVLSNTDTSDVDTLAREISKVALQ